MKEEYYLHQIIEPEDILIVGNAKMWHLLPTPEYRPIAPVVEKKVLLTEREEEEKQDEYLKSKGI